MVEVFVVIVVGWVGADARTRSGTDIMVGGPTIAFVLNYSIPVYILIEGVGLLRENAKHHFSLITST